jgi:hypothetical protein
MPHRTHMDQHLNGSANSCVCPTAFDADFDQGPRNIGAMGPQLTAGQYAAGAMPSACVITTLYKKYYESEKHVTAYESRGVLKVVLLASTSTSVFPPPSVRTNKPCHPKRTSWHFFLCPHRHRTLPVLVAGRCCDVFCHLISPYNSTSSVPQVSLLGLISVLHEKVPPQRSLRM